jgi:hypothetical protein
VTELDNPISSLNCRTRTESNEKIGLTEIESEMLRAAAEEVAGQLNRRVRRLQHNSLKKLEKERERREQRVKKGQEPLEDRKKAGLDAATNGC